MKYFVIGLGNPGKEYENTRHNTGREAVMYMANRLGTGGWQNDKKFRALTANWRLDRQVEVMFVLPETMMNNSGKSVTPLIKSKKDLERLVILYDDLDLPLGTIKISFNRGSGGHRGVESIVRAVKSKAFTRIRIGVSPQTAGGKLKKPQGEKAVVDFILKKRTPKEEEQLKKVFKKIKEAIETFITLGREKAMNQYN